MKTEIGENESVSTAVTRAVSAVTGRKPRSLQQLTEVLDPDALDTLFDPRSDDALRTSGRISFIYSRCRITIDNGAYLTIEPLETAGRLSVQSDGTDRAERNRSKRDSQQTDSNTTAGSPTCIVCQQPIEPEDQQRERGELSRAELRCGISLETGSER